MPTEAHARRYGTVFNEVAGAYDRYRPGYPDSLVDEACGRAGLGPGAEVLEIGCGTGQLTQALLARGLRVTAIEPGDQLLARARDRLEGAGDVRFLNTRLEDAPLADAHYQAVFCASAIHWVDPEVSWRTAAHALTDDGTLALISYFGLEDPRSAADQRALREAMARVAPEPVAAWPTYRDLDDTLAGVAARRTNVSEVWSWLGGYDLARAYAEPLFEVARVAVVQIRLEHTAEELTALLGTMSFWARLSPAQRDAVADENHALQQKLGRTIRSSTVACLVTARRRPRS
jgi:SAM-dependent methyltransferase